MKVARLIILCGLTFIQSWGVAMATNTNQPMKDGSLQNQYHEKTITIYLAGKIPKGHEDFDNNLHWTPDHMEILKESLKPLNVILLNPAFKDCDLSNQDVVFGRDAYYVASSDFVFVDGRASRGLGVGAEMMWAKANGIPVVTWAPKDTHYNKTATVIEGKKIPAFIHPFVHALSDNIVENIQDGARWIQDSVSNPKATRVKTLDSVRSAAEKFRVGDLR